MLPSGTGRRDQYLHGGREGERMNRRPGRQASRDRCLSYTIRRDWRLHDAPSDRRGLPWAFSRSKDSLKRSRIDHSKSKRVRPLSSAEFAELLGTFPRLACWEVALSVGSILRFEFGRHLVKEVSQATEELGSATLWLEADDWRISRDGIELLNSEQATSDNVEFRVKSAFLGASIRSAVLTAARITIVFSRGLSITAWRGADSEMEDDDDLINLFLPDGSIVAFSAAAGLFLSADRDEFRASQMVH
jgi:hypothetical protein